MGSFYNSLEPGSRSSQHLDLTVINFVPKIIHTHTTPHSSAVTTYLDHDLKQLLQPRTTKVVIR